MLKYNFVRFTLQNYKIMLTYESNFGELTQFAP